jgi:hypothetical protein
MDKNQHSKTVSKCPCLNCICKAMCRHRIYLTTITSCPLIRDYVYYENSKWEGDDVIKHRRLFLTFYNILKPKKWFIDRIEGNEGFVITGKPEGIVTKWK